MEKQDLAKKVNDATSTVVDTSKTLGREIKKSAVSIFKNFVETHDYVFGNELYVPKVSKRIGEDIAFKLVYRKEAKQVYHLATELLGFDIKPELKSTIIETQVGYAATNIDELVEVVCRTYLLSDPKLGSELIDEIKRIKPSSKYQSPPKDKRSLLDYLL